MEQMSPLSRRRLLRALAATGAAALFRPQLASSKQARVISKPIAATHSPMRSQYRFDSRDSCDH
jgi:hypothetical protein